jgi:hypothetical protein
MFEKSCRCGKSKKSFKFDIGEFFIDDCCTEAGYDEQGNRAQNELSEEEKALAAAAANAPEADSLQSNDDPSLDAEESEPSQEKPKNKNKNKNKNS